MTSVKFIGMNVVYCLNTTVAKSYSPNPLHFRQPCTAGTIRKWRKWNIDYHPWWGSLPTKLKWRRTWTSEATKKNTWMCQEVPTVNGYYTYLLLTSWDIQVSLWYSILLFSFRKIAIGDFVKNPKVYGKCHLGPTIPRRNAALCSILLPTVLFALSPNAW